MNRVHLGVEPVGYNGGGIVHRWLTACGAVVTDYGYEVPDGYPVVTATAGEVCCGNCLRTRAYRQAIESERGD